MVPWLTQTSTRWRRPPSLILKKNISNSGLDKVICTKFHGKMHHGHAEMTMHVTKNRNRKLIRVTSSNECLKHMCVNLGDYNRYLNKIWYKCIHWGLLGIWVKYNVFVPFLFIYTFFYSRVQVRPVDGFLRAIAHWT